METKHVPLLTTGTLVLTWRPQQSGLLPALTGSLRTVVFYLMRSSVRTHKHIRVGMAWQKNPILACMCMFVRKCRRTVCVYFLNKYRCMLWLAFNSSVTVFIVSLCVGDMPLGQRLTWMTKERNTRCTHTNTGMCTHKPATSLLMWRPKSSQTFPPSQPIRADTV